MTERAGFFRCRSALLDQAIIIGVPSHQAT
jgi:hypothetical protein